MTNSRAFCVCIPARNEAARLPVLLSSLAGQDIPGRLSVVVCVNNTSDGSAEVLRSFASTHSARLAIVADEITFPAGRAHAGSARRRAMDIGYDSLQQHRGAVLMSTDADARAPANWIAENLRAIDCGADIVGGRLVLDENEPLPTDVLSLRLLWDRYWRKVREIEDAVDPRASDPSPRHGDHTGASLALTAEIYRKAGGVPELAVGEDRELVANAVAAGGILVHPQAVWTRVSPRRDGRAPGGMAQAMADLHDTAALGRITLAPALSHWQHRAAWRRRVRHSAGGDAAVARAERFLPAIPCDTPLDAIVEHP
jgi:GT2 family glycosyltransferase